MMRFCLIFFLLSSRLVLLYSSFIITKHFYCSIWMGEQTIKYKMNLILFLHYFFHNIFMFEIVTYNAKILVTRNFVLHY